MFDYQQSHRYFAQVADGIEPLAAEELSALEVTDTRAVYRGVQFVADRAALYRVNYSSRLVSRILAPLATFRCRSTDELYTQGREIDWSALLGVDQTFAVYANLSHSAITQSKFAALRLKDAICDEFRANTGRRPSVDTKSPHVWFHLFIRNDRATLSFDTSGGPLHRRGYRKATREAPLNETLAATIIRLTEWDGERPLVDPMCGSGTLLCEALMRFCHIPSQRLWRRFGFESLPDYDVATWRAVRKEADAAMRPLPTGLIGGSDASVKAVATAGGNVRNLPGGENVELRTTAFEKIDGLPDRVIVTNPPAGIRIGSREGSPAFIQSFGDFLKQRCTGSTVFLYLTDRSLVKHIGLRTTWKKPLKNGGLDGRLVRVDLY
jgi:putative N6-adenine-specific DNA methylase